MTRLTPSTARALDRLARRAHAFHRYAHHPLCAQYRGELIQLGRRTRICRGCTLALSGALLGLGTAALAPASLIGTAALGMLGLALGGSSLVWRAPKLASRLGAAFALSAAIVSGALGAGALRLLALAFALAALAGLFAYRRRGADRRACQTCVEGALAPNCTGFAAIWRRERAFQRAAQKIIYGP